MKYEIFRTPTGEFTEQGHLDAAQDWMNLMGKDGWRLVSFRPQPFQVTVVMEKSDLDDSRIVLFDSKESK